MKFTQTSYTSNKEILKFSDHYIGLAVQVDDTGVVANADGKKIVSAGTIVGGAAASTLSDPTQKVRKHVQNSLTTALTGTNNDLVFKSKVEKTLKVAYIDPAGNDQSLSVKVEGDTINVYLATGGAGAITSTAAQIKAAIDAHLVANDLVEVSNATSNDGTGVVTALVATALTGGIIAEGVLQYDVDVTSGPVPGSMLIHAFVDINKLPEAPTSQAIKSLKQITFLK